MNKRIILLLAALTAGAIALAGCGGGNGNGGGNDAGGADVGGLPVAQLKTKSKQQVVKRVQLRMDEMWREFDHFQKKAEATNIANQTNWQQASDAFKNAMTHLYKNLSQLQIANDKNWQNGLSRLSSNVANASDALLQLSKLLHQKPAANNGVSATQGQGSPPTTQRQESSATTQINKQHRQQILKNVQLRMDKMRRKYDHLRQQAQAEYLTNQTDWQQASGRFSEAIEHLQKQVGKLLKQTSGHWQDGLTRLHLTLGKASHALEQMAKLVHPQSETNGDGEKKAEQTQESHATTQSQGLPPATQRQAFSPATQAQKPNQHRVMDLIQLRIDEMQREFEHFQNKAESRNMTYGTDWQQASGQFKRALAHLRKQASKLPSGTNKQWQDRLAQLRKTLGKANDLLVQMHFLVNQEQHAPSQAPAP